EVEEMASSKRRKPLRRVPKQAPIALRRFGIDTTVGMIFSNLVSFFIILASALVLHAHGKVDIHTSAEAAAALRPLAGDLAFALYAVGIIGTGLLAVSMVAAAT